MRELSTDVAIVGSGIVGLAWAWEAARRGQRVVILERSATPQGGTIRNFGMVWPIGQPFGALYQVALQSRLQWLELAERTGLSVQPCGSIHAVYDPLEAAVLEEFVALARPQGVACEFLTSAEAGQRMPGLRLAGLQAALFSPTECVVDPRQVPETLLRYLTEQYPVTVVRGQTVVDVQPGVLRTATHMTIRNTDTFIASGADLETLFPAEFGSLGIQRCKLHMMRTAPQPGGWNLGPHLAGGLTLGHYRAFRSCASLEQLRAQHSVLYPEFQKFGIHVMASQNADGEVILGDSHEYDAAITPFDHRRIDELILQYLRQM
ncbi:MAG: TIGR03364 family FAD-dependent oxidoreductase, partial [Gemmataceae bacterium]